MPARSRVKKKERVQPSFHTLEQQRSDPRIGRRAVFIPQEGPQEDIFLGKYWWAYEMLVGGSKGGGKTALGRAWLVLGNPMFAYQINFKGINMKLRSDADISYVYHSSYRGLVLRRNRDDLNDWVTRAEPMYRKFGADWHAADSEFVFPGGARIIVDHLADDKAFYSYEGNEIHRLLIEELTLIPEYRLYANVKKNVRTEHPELTPQIMCTTNPPGPGHAWVKDRFISPCPEGGKALMETQRNPITGEKEKIYRTFVPMRLEHNKILLKADPSYPVRLMSDLKTEEEQQAYIHGNWDAMSGLYFRNFRPTGPRPGEPLEAKHVYEPGELPIMSWWPRLLAMDVGFQHNAVVLKAVIRPEGRLHVYGELAEAQMDNEEWGVRIAQWIWQELQQLTKPVVVLWMSHDAFGQKGDPKTRAEQINNGIRKVLGPDASIILNEGEDGTRFLEQLGRQTNEARIVLRRAPRQRVDGWQFLHGLMRFKQLAAPNKSLYNHAFAQQLLENEGFTAYCEYKKAFEDRPPEVLPRFVIENCPLLVKHLPEAVRQDPTLPTGTGTKANVEDIIKTSDLGDDVRDTARYLAMGYKHQTEIEPPDVFVDERVQAALRQNPMLDEKAVFDIRVRGYEQYGEMTRGPVAFNVGRGSPRREGVRIVQ